MAGALDGLHDVPLLPLSLFPAGADLGDAVLLPSGGNTFYVRGNGTSVTGYDYDPPGIRERLIASVAKALTYCVASRGDVIVCLEGHTENLAVANSWPLVAGVKIIGRGDSVSRPVFTFTTATSTVLVNKANVTIANCKFLCAGPAGTTALSVATCFVVSAAGFTLYKNRLEVGIDADQLCTNCITTTSGATDMTIAYNQVEGLAAAVITTILVTTGATNRLKIIGNIMRADAGASGFLLDLSNAAIVENHIMSNLLENITAASTAVIKPHATSTGFVVGNTYFTKDGGTAPAVSGWTTFTTTYQHGLNYCVTTTAKTPLLCPAVDA